MVSACSMSLWCVRRQWLGTVVGAVGQTGACRWMRTSVLVMKDRSSGPTPLDLFRKHFVDKTVDDLQERANRAKASAEAVRLRRARKSAEAARPSTNEEDGRKRRLNVAAAEALDEDADEEDQVTFEQPEYDKRPIQPNFFPELDPKNQPRRRRGEYWEPRRGRDGDEDYTDCCEFDLRDLK
ncbi:hypothetical protein FVE85_3603 [Porphyridium purpureum]|uniref:Uncharacterized protein n=1 Tax=Porphyridium purpureum TaxID=35688 RepID=A0A5J4YLZ1_PORPP|nr:hypothetical protein FVE85_3603 [Porphyridium purpureum]|eukprot:POR6622..scf249_10